jgi:hypothetical protein
MKKYEIQAGYSLFIYEYKTNWLFIALFKLIILMIFTSYTDVYLHKRKNNG